MEIKVDIQEHYKELKVLIQHHTMTHEVDDILSKLNQKEEKNIIGKKDDDFYPLTIEDIVYFYSSNKKIFCDTLSDTYQVAYTLQELESLLSTQGFIRISKFALVQKKMIQKIEVTITGALIMHFKNKKQEVISRRKIPMVKSALNIGGQK